METNQQRPMNTNSPTALPSNSPLASVIHAQNIANEYRLSTALAEKIAFPPPTEAQQNGYRVLVDLKLLHPESHQWSPRGLKVLALSDSGFNAIFADYLDKLLRANERRIMAKAPAARSDQAAR